MIKGIVRGFFIGSLVVGAMALPAEAHRRHPYYGHEHGHPFGRFLAGVVRDLILEVLRPPPVTREPRYYYKGMICQDVQVPGRWELERRWDDGSYPIWRPGYWRRECY